MSSIEASLSQLETSNARWRVGVYLIGLCLFTTILTGAARNLVPEILKTRQLEIVAEDVRSVVIIRANDRGDGVLETDNAQGLLTNSIGNNQGVNGAIDVADNQGFRATSLE